MTAQKMHYTYTYFRIMKDASDALTGMTICGQEESVICDGKDRDILEKVYLYAFAGMVSSGVRPEKDGDTLRICMESGFYEAPEKKINEIMTAFARKDNTSPEQPDPSLKELMPQENAAETDEAEEPLEVILEEIEDIPEDGSENSSLKNHKDTAGLPGTKEQEEEQEEEPEAYAEEPDDMNEEYYPDELSEPEPSEPEDAEDDMPEIEEPDPDSMLEVEDEAPDESGDKADEIQPEGKQARQEHHETNMIPTSEAVQYNMPMKSTDFTFSYTSVSYLDEKAGIDVYAEFVIMPLSVTEARPQLIICVYDNDETKLYLSEGNKPVHIVFDGYSVDITGSMEDGKFVPEIRRGDEFIRDGIMPEIKSQQFGNKGHIILTDDDQDVFVHVFPTTFQNNNDETADFVYLVDSREGRQYGETTIGDPVFTYNGGTVRIHAKWKGSTLYCKIA